MAEDVKTYQGRMHLLQKEMMSRYYAELTAAAEGRGGKSAYMLVSGNPVELVRAFDLLPVYPEVNALQIAVRKQALPYIQKAEDIGYSIDNCAYVKADIGCFFSGRKTPFGTIPLPDLILCNYVGCNVYLQWFEHLAEYHPAPVFNLDIPFARSGDGEPSEADVAYVVSQLGELVALCQRISGKALDERRLRRIVQLSSETGDLWSKIKSLTRRAPSPFDAYFDSVTLMAPLYCLR
jgi:benzoyl-CoA reductase/2-hydroxyglutaryl-CoA dehydratase subunit BcrC/BadD/HgdB